MLEFILLSLGLYPIILVGKYLNSHCTRCGNKFWTWNLFRSHCSSCKKITKAQEYMAEDYLKERGSKKKEEKFTCIKCEVIYKEEYLGGETKDGKICRYCLEEMKNLKKEK